MKKIYHIAKYYHPYKGGIESVVKTIATSLKSELEIEIICYNTQNIYKIEYIDDIKVIRLPVKYKFFSTPITTALKDIFNSYINTTESVLHFHLPNPLAVYYFLKSNIVVPYIVTYHSDIIKQKILFKFYKKYLVRFLNNAKYVIVSNPNLAKTSKIISNLKDNVKVIPFSIKPDRFKWSQAKEEKLTKLKSEINTDNIILFIGRFVYYKGIFVLLESVKNINDCFCILIGNGPLINEIISFINKNNLKDKIRIIDYISDDEIDIYYRLTKIFVLPSIFNSEAFGVVQLESMFFGKPVISTNLDTGVKYVNKHNQSGLIVEPNNSIELTKAIKKLFTDKMLYDKLSAGAKERCNTEFNHNKIIDSIKQLYHNV